MIALHLLIRLFCELVLNLEALRRRTRLDVISLEILRLWNQSFIVFFFFSQICISFWKCNFFAFPLFAFISLYNSYSNPLNGFFCVCLCNLTEIFGGSRNTSPYRSSGNHSKVHHVFVEALRCLPSIGMCVFHQMNGIWFQRQICTSVVEDYL